MQKEKQILLAFFDILGTSKMLNKGDYQNVYDYYTFMAKLCSDTHTPIAVVDRLSRFRYLEIDSSQERYLTINYRLKHCFFSDTFLLWIELDSFLQPTMAGFLEKCCIIFCEALKREIPLRGVISKGTAIMDEENRIFLGKPLAEAAKAEPHQNWLGVGFGRTICDIHPMDMRYTLPYRKHLKSTEKDKKHLKSIEEELFSEIVLDWPSWWRENEKIDAVQIINRMNTNVSFESYYANCISFVEASKKRKEVWDTFFLLQDIDTLSKLCATDDDSHNDEQKVAIQKGVEILTAQNVLDFLQNIGVQNKIEWLDEKDQRSLEYLQNGCILVNEKSVYLNQLKR